MTEQTTASTTENVGLLASLMQSAKLAEARAHAALDAVGISIPKFQALHHLVEFRALQGMQTVEPRALKP